MFKTGKKFDRPLHPRINLNVPALTKISMDIKHMNLTQKDKTTGMKYKYILVILCEVSNFLVALPLQTTQATEICSALINGFIAHYGIPTHIICDQDPAFVSSIMTYMCEKTGIKMITVSPTNHKSLKAEHGIKSLTNILIKHLSGFGKNWNEYLGLATVSYNSYTSPNLDGYSPFELVYGRQLKIMPHLEITPEAPVSGTFKEYHESLQKKLKYLRDHLQQFKDKRLELANKNKIPQSYNVGQLVYLYSPRGALLQTGTRKIACHFVGPLVIYKAISPNQFLLMSLDGIVYPHLIEETRIKPGNIRTTQGNVSTLADLKQVIRTGFKIKTTNQPI
jgi:hypothetical protein